MIDMSRTPAESPSRFPLLFAWVQSGYASREEERPGEKTASERAMKKEGEGENLPAEGEKNEEVVSRKPDEAQELTDKEPDITKTEKRI